MLILFDTCVCPVSTLAQLDQTMLCFSCCNSWLFLQGILTRSHFGCLQQDDFILLINKICNIRTAGCRLKFGRSRNTRRLNWFYIRIVIAGDSMWIVTGHVEAQNSSRGFQLSKMGIVKLQYYQVTRIKSKQNRNCNHNFCYMPFSPTSSL